MRRCQPAGPQIRAPRPRATNHADQETRRRDGDHPAGRHRRHEQNRHPRAGTALLHPQRAGARRPSTRVHLATTHLRNSQAELGPDARPQVVTRARTLMATDHTAAPNRRFTCHTTPLCTGQAKAGNNTTRRKEHGVRYGAREVAHNAGCGRAAAAMSVAQHCNTTARRRLSRSSGAQRVPSQDTQAGDRAHPATALTGWGTLRTVGRTRSGNPRRQRLDATTPNTGPNPPRRNDRSSTVGTKGDPPTARYLHPRQRSLRRGTHTASRTVSQDQSMGPNGRQGVSRVRTPSSAA